MDPPTTEQSNSASENLDRMPALEIARLMNREDSGVAAAVARELPAIAESIELIADRLQKGGRLFYIGAGTSGRLGVLDASECPPTFQTPPEMVTGIIAGGPAALTRSVEGAEDLSESAAADLHEHRLGPRDVLVGIATSGRTPYVLGGLRCARSLGAATIGLTCNPRSELEGSADRVIAVVVGPEVLSGSTRLKAGTATKMVLNMFSTGAMVLLGKTCGNLMVDLRASNSKLKQRSVRIVCQIAGIGETQARERLDQCGGEVKTAIVVERLGLQPAAARKLLDDCHGRLRTALESRPHPRSGPVTGSGGDLVIGVDGGGTKTEAWLGLAAAPRSGGEPAVLGRGLAGPSHPHSAGMEVLVANVGAAVRNAFRDAGMSPVPAARASVGLAGAGQPETREKIQAALLECGIAGSVEVTDDLAPLLAAATGARPEDNRAMGTVALIAGTGSIACGCDRSGKTVRAGGWGPLFGDEGSGYAIGLAGVRHLLQAAEGRAADHGLCPALLDSLQLPDFEALRRWIRTPSASRRAIAGIAPVVLAMASSDPAAAAIADRSAGELAGLVRSVLDQLGSAAGKSWILAVSGGILVHHPLLVERVLELLEEMNCVPEEIITEPHPVAGSLLLARNACSPIS